jgi:hypothetical protein
MALGAKYSGWVRALVLQHSIKKRNVPPFQSARGLAHSKTLRELLRDSGFLGFPEVDEPRLRVSRTLYFVALGKLTPQQ